MTPAKIKYLDRLFGLMLRRRVTVCRMCLNPLDDTAQVSHCYGRANLSVRWSEKNCYLLHNSCHRTWERMDGTQRKEWLTFQLGKEEADKLERDAMSSRKWTDAEVEEMAKRFKE